MAGINKVILIGNLGKDPELRHTPQGQAVANFSLATSENWTDKSGQKQERTEWHKVVVWGKPAELAAKYLSKGRKAYIEGRLTLDTWDDKATGQKRSKLKVVGETLQLLGEKGSSAGGGSSERPPQQQSSPSPQRSGPPQGASAAPADDYQEDDDIPF